MNAALRSQSDRNTINYKILQVLRNRAGEWVSASDICNSIDGKCSRSIGHKLSYIMDEFPEIEKAYLVEGSRRASYRYVARRNV